MTRLKVIATLALALAVSAVAMVGTASGALAEQAAQIWNCDTQAAALVGRGGAGREPLLSEAHADLPASAKGKAGPRFKAAVPVYFHVVSDGSIGSLTDAQIADQIDVRTSPSAEARAAPRRASSSSLPASRARTTPSGSTPDPAAPSTT